MKRRMRDRGEQILVVVLGLVLTAVLAGLSYRDVVDDARREFAAEVDALITSVVDEITLGVTSAEAARSLVLASDEVTSGEFADFIDRLEISERFPELGAVVVITNVDVADTDAFEARIDAMGDLPFAVAPGEPVGDQRWLVTYIEPRAGNVSALGLDLRADPVAREAGIRALDVVAPTMTAPLQLGEALGGQAGLTVVVPIFESQGVEAMAQDVATREEQLLGFTAVFFRGEDLLRAVLADRQVAVTVRDRDVDRGSELIGTYVPEGADPDDIERSRTVDVEVFGRPWSVTVGQLDAPPLPLVVPAVLAGSGVLLTMALALLLGSVRRGEQRAQHLADVATAELAEANADLARVNADLADSNANLQRSNLELSRFAHVASHDLKQPVQLILSFSELLQDLLRSRLGSEGIEELEQTALDKIGEGAVRMRTLIDDFLALADVDRGPEMMGRVEVSAAVHQVLGLLTTEIDRVGASVEVERTDPVIMDPRQLVPLLQNLISNALKFRRNDVVPTVRLRAIDHGRDWVLEVSDNGIGIPEGDREHVFEAFRRLHTREDHEGSGVGLAICAAVAEGHGGTIAVTEGVDGGSCFVVRLPQPPQAPRLAEPPMDQQVSSPVG